MLFMPHQHRRFVADAVSRRDPSGTTKIRQRYEAELIRRFRRLRSLIVEAIVELDVLGLRTKPTTAQSLNTTIFNKVFGQKDSRVGQQAGPAIPPSPGAGWRPTREADAAAPARAAFAFNRPSDKVQAFMDWLYQAQADEILNVQLGTPVRQAAERSWQNVYIDTAYQKGIRDASAKMNRAGANLPRGFVSGAFNRSVHADRVGLIYTRAYSELEGITDTMASQISSVLARGIAEGRGPQSIARDLAGRVDKVGITRARVLARTEVISAHAEASLNAYEEAGVEGVEVEAEFTTAGDDAVCPICEGYEGNVMTLSEARGLIPVHPNCRCAYLPVVS